MLPKLPNIAGGVSALYWSMVNPRRWPLAQPQAPEEGPLVLILEEGHPWYIAGHA